ncbi:hypothetical protein KI659_14625 [Litoribacter alkaliphilus]|uniref:Uncharacterized protein n=1 Tax=Litoribacter ruber TaxID=702568 RepID=A0AAP2CJU1_9BACT|nr:DUF6266 family protein [Litoribacter alkaliphilus]MBS9525250.1 hypothetical protein [Litoribacter alkaliphilus]
MASINKNQHMPNGKMGNLVYYSIHGKLYARKYVVPDMSNLTRSQLDRREKFRQANAFTLPIKAVLDYGFVNFRNGKRSPWNEAMSRVCKNAFPTNSSILSPSNTIVSDGTLTGMDNGRLSWKDDYSVLLEWDNNTGSGSARAGDKVSLLLYHTDSYTPFFLLEGNPRSMCRQELVVANAAKFKGALHAYAFFTRQNPANKHYQVARSEYLGVV